MDYVQINRNLSINYLKPKPNLRENILYFIKFGIILAIKRKCHLTENREFSVGSFFSEQTSLKGMWISIESYGHKTTIIVKYPREEKQKILIMRKSEELSCHWVGLHRFMEGNFFLMNHCRRWDVFSSAHNRDGVCELLNERNHL